PGASILSVPPDWVSRPARMRSRVDFPQPEGPTMQTNSPGAMLRLTSSSASTRPWPLKYSLRSPAISIAAPRRSTAITEASFGRLGRARLRETQRNQPSLWRDVGSSQARPNLPTPLQLAVLVLDHERPEFLQGEIGELPGREPLGRELRLRQAGLQVERLHVEQARQVEASVRIARLRRILVQQLLASLDAGAHRDVDDLPAVRPIVIGLAVVANAAHQGQKEIARHVGGALRPVGIDEADRDIHRDRLDVVVGIGERC